MSFKIINRLNHLKYLILCDTFRKYPQSIISIFFYFTYVGESEFGLELGHRMDTDSPELSVDIVPQFGTMTPRHESEDEDLSGSSQVENRLNEC